MRINRWVLLLGILCILAVLAAVTEEKSRPVKGPTTQMEAGLLNLYHQLALYIRQGLVDYRLPGEYTLFFGPLEEDAPCQVAIEGGDGVTSVGYYTVRWDQSLDWYAITSQSEVFLSQSAPFGNEIGGYEEGKAAAVWSLSIDTQTPPEELPKFDTPPVPVETLTHHTMAEDSESALSQVTYHYVDQRLGLDLMADYPQLPTSDTAADQLVNWG